MASVATAALGAGNVQEESARVRDLREHLIRHGAYINDAIVCAEFPVAEGASYRGVKAIRDLKKDEILVSIPEPMLLSVRSANRDPAIQRARAATLGSIETTPTELTDQQLLAVHLLHEASKGRESSMYVYLRTLPTSFDNFLYLSDGAIDMLGRSHPHAARLAADSNTEFMNSYRDVQPILRALNLRHNLTTQSAYRWAISCIQSRTMFMPGDAVGCLTPYGDLHNHTPNLRPVTLWSPDQADESEEAAVAGEGYFDESRQRYEVVTRVHVAEGHQVFLTYGRLTNLQLFGLYGFVMDDNPWDTFVLPMGRLPEAVQRHVTQDACFFHANGCPSFELMRGIRLAVLKDKERKRWAGVILDDSPVPEGDCELRATEALRRIVDDLLQETKELMPVTSSSTDALVWEWKRTQRRILECLEATTRRNPI